MKPYLNIDLYKVEKQNEKEEIKNNKHDNEIVSKFNNEKVQFSISSKGSDVFDENIYIEKDSEQDIPLILEE